MAEAIVPPGWYEIGRDEVIKGGDKCTSGSGSWSGCFSSVGHTPNTYYPEERHVFRVIREGVDPGQCVLKEDKLWLNPWE